MRSWLSRAVAVILGVAVHSTGLATEREQEQLDRILNEYRRLPPTQDVRQLVELNRELEALVERIRKVHGRSSARLWRKEYEELGLWVGHYSEDLGYSRKLLVEAHRRNPTSPYRKYTLFATILGESTPHDLGSMPDVDQARRYLKEFPAGPYAENVHEVLGFFHDDLFKILRRRMGDVNDRDYKDDCFAPYITAEPYERQLRHARSTALRHLETAIRMRPGSEQSAYRREVVKNIKAGQTDDWHWCAD